MFHFSSLAPFFSIPLAPLDKKILDQDFILPCVVVSGQAERVVSSQSKKMSMPGRVGSTPGVRHLREHCRLQVKNNIMDPYLQLQLHINIPTDPTTIPTYLHT